MPCFILAPRLFDVATTAKALQIAERVGRPAVVKRAHMVNLELAGPAALPAPPSVAFERGPARARPSSIVEP